MSPAPTETGPGKAAMLTLTPVIDRQALTRGHGSPCRQRPSLAWEGQSSPSLRRFRSPSEPSLTRRTTHPGTTLHWAQWWFAWTLLNHLASPSLTLHPLFQTCSFSQMPCGYCGVRSAPRTRMNSRGADMTVFFTHFSVRPQRRAPAPLE